jgi:hypothetical protein
MLDDVRTNIIVYFLLFSIITLYLLLLFNSFINSQSEISFHNELCWNIYDLKTAIQEISWNRKRNQNYESPFAPTIGILIKSKSKKKEFLLKQTWSILASSLWTDLGKNAEKRSLEVVTTSPLPQKIWRSWNRRSDIRGRSRSRRSEVVVVKLLMIKQYLVLLTLIRISFLHECDYVNWSWNEKAVTYVNLMIM